MDARLLSRLLNSVCFRGDNEVRNLRRGAGDDGGGCVGVGMEPGCSKKTMPLETGMLPATVDSASRSRSSIWPSSNSARRSRTRSIEDRER